MQIPDIIRSQDRWLLHATIGLGLCLASTEYERYTGLWIFETRSFVQLILIVALLIVVLGIFIQKTRKSDVRLSHGKTLIIILILLQSIGLSGRLAQMLAIPLPAWFSLFAPLTMQSAGILFLLYAEFFLEVGIKKSLRSLALGILIAGILQVFTMGLPPIITIPLLYTFMPISGFLLIFADRRRSEVHRESEREDGRFDFRTALEILALEAKFRAENPAVQRNLVLLKEWGWIEIEPRTARLACGYEGNGALAETGVIIKTVTEQ